jgi:N6-L-threonylcarbamoyladenine synthase
MQKMLTVLAFESSCDDTGVAVIRGTEVLSNVIANQDVHAQYGGVVPEMASRAHMQHIIPTLDAALGKAGVGASDIDLVAYTQGPGLNGSLLVGATFAKTWAWQHQVPSVPVHHMHAHILAHFLSPEPSPQLPFLCLTVSGGHTQIVMVNAPDDLQVLGSTKDDAAGEAFDKLAKLMGLPYPGGPLIDRLAAQGNGQAFHFARPKVAGLDMSFSGLKTSVLQFLTKQMKSDPDFLSTHQADVAASVQTAILDILMDKLSLDVEQTGIREVAIAGGVSANRGLRAALAAREQKDGWVTHIPPMSHCTDNAAMIAIAGLMKFEAGRRGSLDVAPDPRLPF